MYLSDNGFVSLRSVFGNASHRVKSTGTTNNNNVVYTDGPLRIVVPSCASNTWDGEPLMYTDTIRAVDGQSFPDWSLVTMTAEGGETWCTQKTQQHTTVSSRLNDTGAPTALSASAAASRVSTVVATTIVFSVLLSNSPSAGGASSSFPRLQGLVGTLRLSARCTQWLSGDDDDNSDSTINYPVNDISDNPLLLQLPSSVTQPSISYATGALLGNSALVIVASVVSHGLHKIHRHLEAKAVMRRKTAVILPEAKVAQADNACTFVDGVYTMCMYFLPTTPLPASLLLFQGLLLEPTVNAAVVSVASGDRGVTSVILGLVIGLGWIALPCVFLWLLYVCNSPLPVATVAVRRIPNVRLRFERIGRALEWLCAERE
ncbi:transmembrane protein, putative, partial [Bodo saltans]